MLKVYTSRIGYRGDDALDVTVKSATGHGRAFRPTWEIVMAHKAGRISDEEYTERYLAMLRHSYRTQQASWRWLLAQESVTLLCYCRPGKFCHRHILKDVLVKLGAVDGGER